MVTSNQTAVEILDLRHFRSSDLRWLLDQESHAWARQLSWDYSSSAEMILRYMDARILPGYAAVEGERVLGYTFFVYEGSKGVIGDLFVNAEQSPQGRWSEEEFQGAASVITAAYRDHIDSEINDQYRTTAGSMRFLNNIVRFPGCGLFDPESSMVARSKLTRAPLGVILCSRVRNDVGHIT